MYVAKLFKDSYLVSRVPKARSRRQNLTVDMELSSSSCFAIIRDAQGPGCFVICHFRVGPIEPDSSTQKGNRQRVPRIMTVHLTQNLMLPKIHHFISLKGKCILPHFPCFLLLFLFRATSLVTILQLCLSLCERSPFGWQ
jgi:hypothetical protein